MKGGDGRAVIIHTERLFASYASSGVVGDVCNCSLCSLSDGLGPTWE